MTQRNISAIPLVIILIVSSLLRFYNLMHDSPYFFNPDERNMAIAVSQFRLPNNLPQILICLRNDPGSSSSSNDPGSSAAKECNLNPHFFAYGQFPLYLAFASDQAIRLLSNIANKLSSYQTAGFFNISLSNNYSIARSLDSYLSTPFSSAIFWLRFWSALSSTLTVLLVYLVTKEIVNTRWQLKKSKYEARNSQQIINSKFQFPKLFRIFNFGNWNLFRISDLEFSYLAAILTAFIPGLIQAAHFGTTESLLTFFFTASVYFSIKLLNNPYRNSLKKYLILNTKYIILLSLVIGLAIGSKLTGLFFFAPLILCLMIQIVKLTRRRISIKKKSIGLLGCWVVGLFLLLGSIVFSILASPYNLIDIQNFKGAVFGYEADVAMGRYEAFYTRQFVETTPIIFQMEKIFPYTLGWPVFILGAGGFLLMILILSLWAFQIIYQRITNNESRIIDLKFKNFSLDSYFLILASFLIYFLPNAFLFAKWTRFMTPVFPLFSIFASYLLFQLYHGLKDHTVKSQISNLLIFRSFKFLVVVLTFAFCVLSLLPGVAFMSIYAHPDSRVTASEWIWQNIPDKSYILFETANVIDIPLGISGKDLPQKSYTQVSFDFYHIDENRELFNQLLSHLEQADYIFIPSRRIFANYLRLPYLYPLITKYYQLLSSGALGFEKIAQFSSFPRLEIGNWKTEIDDEQSEESFTVFDHPVIRIYKKVKSMTKEEYKLLLTI